MKKTLKIKLLSGLFSLSVVLGAIAFFGYNPQIAFADASANDFAMLEGASVRLTDENRGIRFAAEFNDDFYNADAEYHMMIIPAVLTTKYSLTQESDFYKVLVEENDLNIAITNCLPEEKNGKYYIYGSLTDILYENSNRKFFGIAYRELEGERVYATYNDGQNERTICEVASKALNDLSAEHSDDNKDYLLGMINDAYKKELGLGKDDTPDEALSDVLSVTADTSNFIVTKGEEISFDDMIVSTKSEITDKLGLSLGVYSTDETIISAGKGSSLTAAADKSGMVSVGSVFLGEKVAASERKVMVRSEMAGNMLEDYADECSKSQFERDKQTDVNGNVETLYFEEFEGRNGVIKIKSGININGNGNGGVVRYFYNRSYEEMISLDFDYISIWAYFDNLGNGNETVTIKNGTLVLGDAVAPRQWVELKISKADIDSASSFYKSYENFCARHDQVKQHGSVSNNGTMLLSTSIEGIDVYLDSVSFVKASVNGNAPVAGTKYSVPNVELLGIGGNVLDTTSTVTATRNGKEVMIKNGEISNIYRGIYDLNYIISVDEQNVNYTLSYNVSAMAANMLEDFDVNSDSSIIKAVPSAYGAYGDTAYYVHPHDEFEGRTGVMETVTTKLGTTKYGQAKIGALFNRTYEELTEMSQDFDYLSIWIYIDAPGFFTVSSHNHRYITEASQQIAGKKWQEIRMSRDDIENKTQWNESFYSSQYPDLLPNDTAYPAMNCFNTVHSSDKGGGYQSYLFALGQQKDTDFYIQNGLSEKTQYKVYIDSISFGKNA